MASSTISPNMIGGADWMAANPYAAYPYLVIATSAAVIGFFGNIMVLSTVAINKNLRNARNAFLVNLAIADTMVTAIADPFSVLGVVMGKPWFDDRPWLCDFIATVCLTSCVTALLSIGGISFNRYLHICHPAYFDKVFNLRNNILMCIFFWCAGMGLSLPALFGWTSNVYDEKYLECIWNRLHSSSFNYFFTFGIVFTPVILILFSYLRIFMHVRASKKRVAAEVKGKEDKKDNSLKLAKTLFLIFSIFVFCWTPYSLIVVFDQNDQAPLEVHLYVLLLAHLHSTFNSIIYGFTNQHFKAGYRMIATKLSCGKISWDSEKKVVVVSQATEQVGG